MIKCFLLTVLLLANLLVLAVTYSVKSKHKTDKNQNVGLYFLSLLAIANIFSVIGGIYLW